MQGIRKLVEPTGHEYNPGQRQARTSLRLVKQGTMEKAAQIKNRQISHLKTIFGGCTVHHKKVSLEGNLDTLAGERGKLQSPQSQILHDRCYGTWPWKSFIRLILCLDTIFYTTGQWLSRKIVVAHSSGILYLKTVHKLNTTVRGL